MRSFLICLLSFFIGTAFVQGDDGLTANDLANVLDIRWWTVAVPRDLGSKDNVVISIVDSSGRQIEPGVSISPGPADIKFDHVRVFCWEDKSRDQMWVKVQVGEANGTVGGCATKDYFQNSAYGGPANGTLLQPEDIFLKFDGSRHPSFSEGNHLLPGQVGIKIKIKRG